MCNLLEEKKKKKKFFMGEEWFSRYYLKEQTLDFSILLLLFLTVSLLSAQPWQYKHQSEKHRAEITLRESTFSHTDLWKKMSIWADTTRTWHDFQKIVVRVLPMITAQICPTWFADHGLLLKTGTPPEKQIMISLLRNQL